jgi:hypothetical protein
MKEYYESRIKWECILLYYLKVIIVYIVKVPELLANLSNILINVGKNDLNFTQKCHGEKKRETVFEDILLHPSSFHSWTSFNRYHFLIYIHVYTVFAPDLLFS